MSEHTIVAHPETGLPVREVKTYQELDREQLEQEVKDNEAELAEVVAAKTAEFEASLSEDPDVKAARGAVKDSKSELDLYDQLAPVGADAGAEEGASVEDESDDEAGDDAESSDESEGADAESDGAVAVPITTVTADEDDSEEEAEEATEDEEEY